MRSILSRTLFGILALGAALPLAAQQKKTLGFTDLMKVRQVEQPSISTDGRWVAFTAEPDRGDPEVVVRSTGSATRYSVPLASDPVLSKDGRWVAMRLNASLEARERAGPKDAPRRGMTLLSTADGDVQAFEDVESFAFSGDGAHLLYRRFAPLEPENDDGDRSGDGQASGSASSTTPRQERGTDLVVRRLDSGAETVVAGVRAYELDGDGLRVATWIVLEEVDRDGLYVRRIGDGAETRVGDPGTGARFSELTWSETGALAFVRATEVEEGEPADAAVMSWGGQSARVLASAADAPDGWVVPTANDLVWSEDGSRLFFGWRPRGPADRAGEDKGTAADKPFDAYDIESILADRGVDVWHVDDPQINSQQKVQWSRTRNRTFRAVVHLDGGRVVSLADEEVPDVRVPDNASVAVATSDVPYSVEATWEGGQDDAYVVDLSSGARTLFAERLRNGAQLSPDGRFAAYWLDDNYHLYDVATGTTRNLTVAIGVPFADEDHDYPEPAPGYGIGGWLEGDAAAFVYDKYDVWVVPTDGSRAWRLSAGEGRKAHRVFRLTDIGREDGPVARDQRLVLSSYHDLDKGFGYYAARADRPGVTRIIEEDARVRVIDEAEDADILLFTREDYDVFPDLWVAGLDFRDERRVSDVNPQIAEFGWGTSELVEWQSLDGRRLQGVVIKPGNYEEGKRYPVVVYYYRFMSDRLHAFNDPSVNHRPSFPIYASDGYVVFLPDVRFEVGRPGFSSTKSVVPGVQHLIDIGLADPDRIALHGHSWSGYQTAFMVTQTDIFATAIAGAPVGNMTSAYSGIRLGSGLARQFQYENGQSRLSGSLWEARDEYIDNSPIFFADRINTPMLILHGNEDDAVPWEQSIELYMALRRLGKETVFLEYRGEPHHPQQYANKLDWAIKMKEWIDHYLKDTPAPAWISKGVPYSGR